MPPPTKKRSNGSSTATSARWTPRTGACSKTPSTEDVTGDYGGRLHFTNRAELVEYMRSSIGPGVITEHRVTHPEITVDGDEATAVWYLQDRVIAAEFNFMLIGAAFYHDTYRRTPDGWKISATGYDRTYEATMSLEGLNFKLKPGPALQI